MYECGRDSPRQRNAKCLLTIRDEELTRAKTVKVARQIHAERAHIGAHRNIGCEDVLEFRYEPQGMNRNPRQGSRFGHHLFSTFSYSREEGLKRAVYRWPTQTRCQSRQCFFYASDQF